MDTIGKRIAFLIDEKCAGNRSEFARIVGITPAYAAQLYADTRVPADRTIRDICDKFNVNSKWLRDGEEPIFMPLPEEDTAYINDLLNELDNPFIGTIKAIMQAYNESSPEDKKRIKDFAARFTDKMQKEDRD